ncbi:GNAT family N-acetyltransferase [Simiduia agarivorans]|uniref:Acetyltransferase n=1 Tax=Simiduia agarivorans (strain DSM 21679 / JCM 13881 / BCRC 17597 / SA1) TaxID=1117647 RepID=K4KRJ9_SIMAS|nr:N-acetyltransferase [Simiduia agarivorans]AFV00921.1 acetyltransferase [Simiduia agarivorans SA1 = DSM 21679]
MPLSIRNETPDDIERIRAVTVAAFLHAPHTDHTEQFIVEALRDAGALTLSLVAEQAGAIIGHVAVSPVAVSDGSDCWFGLGPISVTPDAQGQGVGTRLMQAALAALRDLQANGCVLLGDPAFYQRFGFSVIEGLTLPGVPPEYFQAIAFNGCYAQGEVTYHAAFAATGPE